MYVKNPILGCQNPVFPSMRRKPGVMAVIAIPKEPSFSVGFWGFAMALRASRSCGAAMARAMNLSM